jgi:DinB superfamily
MNETLNALSATPEKILDLLNRLEKAGKLDLPREPGKWTPRQILAHLADVEAVQTVRVMAMLAQDNPVMLGFNADDWAAAGRYATRAAERSARSFIADRERNLELWSTLSSDQLERKGTHPSRGEFTVGAWLGFVSKHDANHLAQLEASL